MNLLTTTLPDTITVDGREYAIHTDFRDWIRFCEMLLDEELKEEEKVYIALMQYKEEQPSDIQLALKGLTDFYLMEEETKEIIPEETEEVEEIDTKPPLYNWSVDSTSLS